MVLSATDLHAVMPAAPAARVNALLDSINRTIDQYGMDTLPRTAGFLANVAVETMQLQYMREIWGPTRSQVRYDPPGTLAQRLGNTLIGDGRRYRGGGLLMLTGRAHFQTCGDALGYALVDNPDVIEHDLRWAAATAGWFWGEYDLNAVADQEDITALTMAINGGTNGLEQRRAFYDRAFEVLPCGS